jgi:hypothetical protein
LKPSILSWALRWTDTAPDPFQLARAITAYRLGHRQHRWRTFITFTVFYSFLQSVI